MQTVGATVAGDSDEGRRLDEAGADDAGADLLQVGAAMLQSLAAQRRPGAASLIRIERDPESGQPSLRIPMPDPALFAAACNGPGAVMEELIEARTASDRDCRSSATSADRLRLDHLVAGAAAHEVRGLAELCSSPA